MLRKTDLVLFALFVQCLLLGSTLGSSLSRFNQEEFSCPAQDGFYGLAEGRCTSDYYTCIEGLAFHAECPPGITRNMVRVDTYTCPTSDGFFPIPGKCTADYYICVSGSPYVTTCPNATLFDPCTSICTRPSLTSCNQPYVCPQANGFFPTSLPCTREYYTCIDGGAYISYCPGTSIFEPSVNTCVAADKAPCKNQTYSYCPTTTAASPTSPTTTVPTTTTTPATTTTTPATTTTTPATTTTTPATTTTTPTTTTTTPTTTTPTTTRPSNFSCPPGVSGNYAYPGQCSLYYACQSNGNYIVAQCPPGQAFSPSLAFCTNPADVPGCTFRFLEYFQASRFVGLRGGPQ